MTYNGTTHAQLRRYTPHSATATTRGRRRVKTSPFTCHCKNTTECVTSRFLHLIGGAVLLFHWQRKVASSIQADSRLSAMKHLLLQPTPRRDVDSLNQCWQTALVQPFLRKKKKKSSRNSDIRLYHFNLLAKAGGSASSRCSRTLHHMPTHAWNTIANPGRGWSSDTRAHQQMKAEGYQVKLQWFCFENALKSIFRHLYGISGMVFPNPAAVLDYQSSPNWPQDQHGKNKEINSITDAWEGSRCSLRGPRLNIWGSLWPLTSLVCLHWTSSWLFSDNGAFLRARCETALSHHYLWDILKNILFLLRCPEQLSVLKLWNQNHAYSTVITGAPLISVQPTRSSSITLRPQGEEKNHG